MHFPNWLLQRSRQNPEAIALNFVSPTQEVKHWTYSQLQAEVELWIAYLQGLGVQAGDRVGLLLTNHPHYLLIVHALVQSEAIAVFLNTRLTAAELNWQIEDSQAQYLICDEFTQDLAKNLQDQIQDLIVENCSSSILLSRIKNQNENINLENIQGIFYTSGTTGKPKAVPLTYHNHFHSAITSALHLRINHQDNWLLCMPMFHVGGLAIAWRSVIYGTAITLLPKFDEQEVLTAIANQGVTLISLVPTMLTRLLRHPLAQNLCNSKVRAVLLGGAPADPDLIEQCLELNLLILPTYGMTETASQITTMPSQKLASKRGSVGLPLFGNRLRIVELDNPEQEVEIDEIGQILVQSPSLMTGYLHQPKHEPNLHQEYWFPTGDLGYRDRDGYLYVVSRRSDLIISGGENIYPSEIEAILLQHPAIAEVCVVGVSDSEWGESVAAVMVASSELSLAEVREFCLQKSLAKYKLPKSIYIWESLPKTASGKLLRQNIRDFISQ
ncbi:o-succinylbenzoate--CoA ligase [Pseudanabaena sp. FACHB-1998]|uniref:o-succinylbenzoate--CoA ligase n=1 Tax=Pseudanabaena sp. FACHB-1998 TaxID=2692858 RepID=UPI0016804545|nr:o-succinylbenzoate--CoA ligase [Pseudanabaena sp. FACHB-1998]MBD2176086.1 o-succinylbenzoate--CoA ligase [Pseudanabaena sp. FACHB-1998]